MNDGFAKNVRFRRRAFYVEEKVKEELDHYMSPEVAKKYGIKEISIVKQKLHHDPTVWLCTIDDNTTGLIFYGISRLHRKKDKYFKTTAKAYAHSRASNLLQRYHDGDKIPLWLPETPLGNSGMVDKKNIKAFCATFNSYNFSILENKEKK